jgi:hypothetical protein
LLELIDQADIFQLFWSWNSMKSEYVRREYEHALALGRRGFIHPNYWEVPMPQSSSPPLPPPELAKLHFYGFFEESDASWAALPPPAQESPVLSTRPRQPRPSAARPSAPLGARRARSTRRLWLIVIILAVLVALEVVVLLRT